MPRKAKPGPPPQSVRFLVGGDTLTRPEAREAVQRMLAMVQSEREFQRLGRPGKPGTSRRPPG